MRELIVAVLMALAPFGGTVVNEVKTPVASKIVVMDIVGDARTMLESSWDNTNPKQMERGFCVSQYDYQYQEGYASKIVIKSVRPAIVRLDSLGKRRESPKSLAFDCPNGAPAIHTHPPTTCADWDNLDTCYIGGDWAHICYPSDADMLNSIISGGDIIQCDRNKFVFYNVSGYRWVLTISDN